MAKFTFLTLKMLLLGPNSNLSTRWNSVSYVWLHIWNSTGWIQSKRMKKSFSTDWKNPPKFHLKNFHLVEKIQPDEIHSVDTTKISAFYFQMGHLRTARLVITIVWEKFTIIIECKKFNVVFAIMRYKFKFKNT